MRIRLYRVGYTASRFTGPVHEALGLLLGVARPDVRLSPDDITHNYSEGEDVVKVPKRTHARPDCLAR